jgi:hypothetical protein
MLDVKLVEQAMDDWSQDDSRDRDQEQAAVQGVQPGEQLRA